MDCFVIAVCNERGEIASFVLYGRDITERKWAKEVLRELYERESNLRRQLEAEIERRIESTRGLVHELKTPVTTMMASSELMAEELPEGTLPRSADDIDRSTSNLNRMIGELLNMASGEM